MKEALVEIIKNIAKLINTKTIVTLGLTAVLIVMLLGEYNPSKELLALYCTSYGAITTYFFTKKDKDEPLETLKVVNLEKD